MISPRNIILLIIVLIFLAGVYEKFTGNVVDGEYYLRNQEVTHLTISGNFLIYFSALLLGIFIYVLKSTSNDR